MLRILNCITHSQAYTNKKKNKGESYYDYVYLKRRKGKYTPFALWSKLSGVFQPPCAECGSHAIFIFEQDDKGELQAVCSLMEKRIWVLS